MKKLFLLLILSSLSLCVYSQNPEKESKFNYTTNPNDKYGVGAVPVKNGIVTFTMINQSKGESKSDLYASAKVMIAELFNSANDVIQSDDKDNGIIVCKGNAKIEGMFTTDLMEFTLKVSCKDERYKIDLYNISLTLGYGDKNPILQNCNQTIIDEVALKNGKVKKIGGGKQRRMVIDKKDEIFASITEKMKNQIVETEEEW